MTRLPAAFLLFSFLSCVPQPAAAAEDMSIESLIDAPVGLFKAKTPVTVTGRITWTKGSGFVIDDDRGHRLLIHNKSPMRLPPAGSVVRINCITDFDRLFYRYITATNISVLSRGVAPPAVPATCRDIVDGRFDFRTVTVSGVITDFFNDEIDDSFAWIILRTKSGSLMVSIPVKHTGGLDAAALIDADVDIRGACIPYSSGLRQYINRTISISGPEDITVVNQAPPDPFAAGYLSKDLSHAAEKPLHRQRIDGTVLATWHGNQMFLLCDDGRRFKVVLAGGETLPAVGTGVCVAGFLDFDAFYPSFIRARLRKLDRAPRHVRETPLEIRDVTSSGRRPLDPLLNGQAVRVKGIARYISRSAANTRCLYLETGNTPVAVELGDLLPDMNESVIGCEFEATGICLMRTESPGGEATFSRITGLSVIPRDGTDVRQLTFPPFWTPLRLSTVITALIVALVAVLFWNRILKRMVEHRGRALFRSEIKTVSAELKTEERTRLAVELHDSVSQNLTAVSFQLDLVSRLVGTQVPKAVRPLEIATKTLRSSRDDLRNCIWDLRNQALDEPTMDAAIRKALIPHIAGTRLSVRFSIPRNRLSDNTAHTILQIVRELVSNAVRHGRASLIRIAGAVENDTLLFSVADDGGGFDVGAVPGARDGHFGLGGIQERIRHFNGTMAVDSVPGSTRVSVTLKLQHIRKDKNDVP